MKSKNAFSARPQGNLSCKIAIEKLQNREKGEIEQTANSKTAYHHSMFEKIRKGTTGIILPGKLKCTGFNFVAEQFRNDNPCEFTLEGK